MKRLILMTCAFAAVLVLPVTAIAQPAHADSAKTTMTLVNPLVVGAAVLQPGAYKFQCRTIAGKTFLIVTSIETGKELARVACEREMLDAKVRESEFLSVARPDGTRAMTVVRIKGDMVAHRLLE